jgi:hypothetical protein
MVNETILGALKSALERKESLKKAMMTLYNAGYKKEEISEAARLINERGLTVQAEPVMPATPEKSRKILRSEKRISAAQLLSKQPKFKQVVNQPLSLPIKQPSITPQQNSQPPQPPVPQAIPQNQQQIPNQMQQLMQQPPAILQKVSGYGQTPTPKGKTTIILLGFLLLILIGILATMFLFKEELLDFFNNLFS